MMKLSASTMKLVHLARQMADRFERLGVDEEGHMDPDDKKLLAAIRKQAELVVSEPMRKHLSGK